MVIGKRRPEHPNNHLSRQEYMENAPAGNLDFKGWRQQKKWSRQRWVSLHYIMTLPTYHFLNLG